VWKEKHIPTSGSKAVTVYRIRFEKADLTEPSWWSPEVAGSTQPMAAFAETLKASVATCGECGTPSKEIFAIGWFCLNYECGHYYVFPNGVAVDPKGLAYSEAFINERTPFGGEIPSVTPPLPDHSGLHGTELALRSGFVCPDCGCCNRRVYWNRWVCENKDCQYTQDAPMLPYPDELLEQENKEFDSHMASKRKRHGVNENTLKQDPYPLDPFATIYQRGYLQFSQTLTLGGYKVRQYFLPDSQGIILGSFSIFSATKSVNCKPDGPDDLFRALELTDIGLRRNPAAVIGRK
jgi:hypothetical protein